MVTIKEYVMNMPDDYVSISTRLPKVDAIMLQELCRRQGTTASEYIRNLIKKNIDSPQKKFLAGKNKIIYDKIENRFRWVVELDNKKEILILESLSDDFLKNINHEIQEAIKERNQWVHQTKDDSVDVPGELVGGEK